MTPTIVLLVALLTQEPYYSFAILHQYKDLAACTKAIKSLEMPAEDKAKLRCMTVVRVDMQGKEI